LRSCWGSGTRFRIAAISEIAKHRSRGLLAPISPHQPKRALAYRSRNGRPVEETRIVVAVAPRVRTGRADAPQSTQDRIVVLARFFLGRQKLIPSKSQPGMALWRERLFVSMAKNATKAIEFFNVPTNRVVELGTQVEL